MGKVHGGLLVKSAKAGLIGILMSTLTACHLPAGVDDFTVLENDVLSDLLRHSYAEVNLTPGHSPGSIGVGRINQSTLESLANDLFIKQEQSKVKEIFIANRGECIPGDVRDSMLCTFVRKWKLKNIGARFDTSNWADPAAKVNFTFTFDEHGRVRTLNATIIDATVYKVIRG